MTLLYIGPFAVALLYTLGALFIKQAMSNGAGVARSIFVSNILIFGLMLLFFGFNVEIRDASVWPWAVLGGGLEFLGSMLLVLAIQLGSVSIQTPLMGTKVIFVAIFSWLIIPAPMPMAWWVGAILTFLGVFMLGYSGIVKKGVSRLSILAALSSSGCFALVDVLVQRHAPVFGENAFLIFVGGVLALTSFLLVPFFRKRTAAPSATAWRLLLSGASLMAFQLMGFLYLISHYGQATLINILYSSRGVMSIAAIWFIGHWFANDERDSGKSIILRRLGAAVVICAGIVVTLLSES